MKFRIKKYPKGYVVEIQKVKNYILFKRHYWTHYISPTGMDSQPWHHAHPKYAMMNLLDKIEKETKANS